MKLRYLVPLLAIVGCSAKKDPYDVSEAEVNPKGAPPAIQISGGEPGEYVIKKGQKLPNGSIAKEDTGVKWTFPERK